MTARAFGWLRVPGKYRCTVCKEERPTAGSLLGHLRSHHVGLSVREISALMTEQRRLNGWPRGIDLKMRPPTA